MLIGILAYGSLIDNPGSEIEPLIVNRIECTTPFNVEYARSSSSRNGAPTLIPYKFGKPVNATLLVLKDDVDLQYAKDILWRREIHKVGIDKGYKDPKYPSLNKVIVKEIPNFLITDVTIYTFLGSNIDVDLEILSNLAIESILSDSGELKKDGLRYLQSAIDNGIETNFTNDYKNLILEKTGTATLNEAIDKLDLKRRGLL